MVQCWSYFLFRSIKQYCNLVLTKIAAWVHAGKPPSAFPQDRLRLDFRSILVVGDALAAVLEGLLVSL